MSKEVEVRREKGKKLKDEFVKFIMRGNVLDLAVGVIVGGAFSKIVTSLVNDVLMPLIGIVSGGIDFTNLSITIKDATINYGMFLQNIIDFLIVAVCIFTFIKIVNKIFTKEKKEEETKDKIVKKTDEVLLLEEIRDLLKKEKPKRKTTKRSSIKGKKK